MTENLMRSAVNLGLTTMMLIAVAFNAPWAHGGESDTASMVAKDFQSALIKVMKDADKMSVAERYEHLAPTVDRSFHMPLMTQISAGNYWQSATRDEKEQLTKAFHRMSVATLATFFSGYSGEVFTVGVEKPGPSKTTLVMTKLIKFDKSEIDIAYVMRRFKSGWRMIDVIVDSGISELKVRRSEYRLVLKKGGVPALISLLNNKADQLMSE